MREMDPGFINDTTIYYNFPPPPPLSSKDQRRFTLPRPQSAIIFDRPTSCPTTPKLSCSRNASSVEHSLQAVDCSAILTTLVRNCKVEGNEKTTDINKSVKQNTIGNGCQNTEKTVSKPKKKTLFFPWWRKRRLRHDAVVPEVDIKEVDDINSNATLVSLEESEPLTPPRTYKPATVQLADETLPLPSPSNYLSLPTMNSSCSSSTTLNDDEDNSCGDPCAEVVLGGISYIKPSERPQSGPLTSTPQDAQRISFLLANKRNNGVSSHKIAYWIREWRRKSRWLSRRKRERNPRHDGEGDVDIAILHYGADTCMWADYLQNNFLFLLEDELGQPQIRVQKINLQSFCGYKEVPEVQASRLRDAKLQIVLISPSFLAFIRTECELKIGKLLRPERVLALLLSVQHQTVKNDPVALSALYSFDEWLWLQVRDRDEDFVSEVQEESLRILTTCEVFDDCKPSAAFSICPRKITQSYCKAYIHLKAPLNNSEKNRIKVVIAQSSSSSSTSVSDVKVHNPFTLSFDVPEQLLGISSFLKIELHIGTTCIGSREVKCEGPLEVLKDLLKSAVDPTGLMCQALGICPLSNELDNVLAQKVKIKLPTQMIENKHQIGFETFKSELPTWLHFGAFYGLQSFSWALLDVPSGEKALLVKNCKGQTPAILALEAGYTKLAQDLENVALVTTLAQEASFSIEKNGSSFSFDGYNQLPKPRLFTTKERVSELSIYDTPPQPVPIEEGRSKTTLFASVSKNLSLSTVSHETLYANLQLDTSSISDFSCASLEVNEEHGDKQQYLDMSGNSLQFEEYQKDICILVDAWGKRDDAKTFLKEYEQTISKLKENLNFKTPSPEVCQVIMPQNGHTGEDSSSDSEEEMALGHN